jgi:tetratricopeptide (TPR) repeat protein
MIRLYLYSAFLFLFVAGCAPAPRVSPEEIPLKLPAGPGQPASPEQEGRQAASLQLTQEGREYLHSSQLEEAMSKFQKAISLSSSNPYAYYYLAEARYRQQEYPQSLPLLDRAELFFLSNSVWLSKVHVLRGKNYEALSRFEEAKGQYQQALAEDSDNPEASEGIQRLQNPEGVQ